MSFADIVFPIADMTRYWWIPVTAILLDACLGDPPAWPHPVRYIGALCDRVERFARRMIPSARLSGCVAVLLVLCGTWIPVRALLLFPRPLALAAAVYLCFAGLAQGQLLREGRAALALVERGEIEAARVAVGMLVSRDVSRADETLLCRSLAETLAENFNDAFIAPLFWLVIGGPAGLWLYKAASTMDSMWGYPYEPWTRFGTAAARLDDVLAYVPARLTAFSLYCAASIRANLPGRSWPENGTGRSSWPGFARIAADARKMKSPNAGWPMAASAWIHNASMGGPTIYAGVVVDKPALGPTGIPWSIARLKGLCDTISMAGAFGSVLLLALGCVFHCILA